MTVLPNLQDPQDVTRWAADLVSAVEQRLRVLEQTAIKRAQPTQTFRGTDINSPSVEIVSEDESSDEGPEFAIRRNSPSPAANDKLGAIVFWGRNSAGEDVRVAKIVTRLVDPTDGSEDGQIELSIVKNGVMTGIFALRSDGSLTMLETGVRIIAGSGSPESAVGAPVGSFFLRKDGGTSTTIYAKEGGGTGSTGWVAK